MLGIRIAQATCLLAAGLLRMAPASRFVPYLLLAFLPVVSAWWRLELGESGVGELGPSRTQVLVVATVESLAGASCAALGLDVLPLFGVGAAVLVACWLVDWTGNRWPVEIAFAAEGLVIRTGQRVVVAPWATLNVRRRGPYLSLEWGENRARARFASARADEIAE